MPIYEYLCEKCGKTFEEFTLSMNSKTKVKCPDCGGNGSKKVSGFAAHSKSSSSSCQMPDGSCGMTGGGCSGGGCPFGG